MAMMMPVMSLIMKWSELSVYWIGAYLIASAGMMDKLVIFSNMIVFSAYAMQVVMAFMMMSMISYVAEGIGFCRRIMEVIETKPIHYRWQGFSFTTRICR